MDATCSMGLLRAPNHLLFGSGQRKALAELVGRHGQSVLLVTDARMAGEQSFREMQDALIARGLEVRLFDGVAAELPVACVYEGAKLAAGVDVIVGIGGGSCLDAAKCIAVLQTHGGEISDYYGEFQVPGPVTRIIAVPTTAGTGSEVTPVAVVDDPARALKVGVSSPYLIPVAAICDPELTGSCPPGLTAASGADALTHAIEAYSAVRRPAQAELSLDRVFVGKNVISDALALEAIRLISGSLSRAVADGGDLVARAEVMLGSTLAGLAFGTAGTAAAHAIQYPVGALTYTSHGVGVATLLPYVMAWNRPQCEQVYAEIGTAMGLPVAGSLAEQADAAIAAIAALFHTIGIPPRLVDLGVPREAGPDIVRLALSVERLISNNPRKLDAAGLSALVQAAFDGVQVDKSSEPHKETTA